MKTVLTWTLSSLFILTCRSELNGGDSVSTDTPELEAAGTEAVEAQEPILPTTATVTSPSALAPEAAFKRGTELMAKRQFAAALPLLEQTAAALPGTASVLWNLGLVSAELSQNDKALGYWQRYGVAQPSDWRALPKLIQAHQALGDVSARDRQIEALYDLRARPDYPDLQKSDRFCREQFSVSGLKVFAFEFFEPRSSSPVFYRFSIVDTASGKETSFTSLGSDDTTTNIERELGDVAPGARVYHLDHYAGKGHQTLAFYEEKPTYDLVRAAVLGSLQPLARPLSSSSGGTRDHSAASGSEVSP